MNTPNQPRFLTVETNNGTLTAFTETEAKEQQPLTNLAWDEFVWQFAPDKTTAIAQHYAKNDLWREDVDAGRPEKDTY